MVLVVDSVEIQAFVRQPNIDLNSEAIYKYIQYNVNNVGPT